MSKARVKYFKVGEKVDQQLGISVANPHATYLELVNASTVDENTFCPAQSATLRLDAKGMRELKAAVDAALEEMHLQWNERYPNADLDPFVA